MVDAQIYLAWIFFIPSANKILERLHEMLSGIVDGRMSGNEGRLIDYEPILVFKKNLLGLNCDGLLPFTLRNKDPDRVSALDRPGGDLTAFAV